MAMDLGVANGCSGSPSKRRRVMEDAKEETCKLGWLLATRHPGPPDFGGRLASMLWGVHVQYSSAVEYLALFFGGGKRPKDSGERRIVTPELYALLRCSKAVRKGVIAAIEDRRLTVESTAPQEERENLDEMCDAMRHKYPESWAIACGGGQQPPACERPAPVVLPVAA
eukprot:gb/GFBE01062191.1/.p1 GENE.gb/GFBE01062191.1/~~gb/GFBE01062191.1/.p1  ORF type:complete len:169 (+),score=18.18 gb/GFBE01062191.1/:1-507(+)